MKALLVSILILVVLLGGCISEERVSEESPVGQPASDGQSLDIQEIPWKSYIEDIGFHGMNVTITPTQGNVLQDNITIKVTRIPPDATAIGFVLVTEEQKINETGPNLGIDRDGSDGWGIAFDTADYANGLYSLIVLAGNETGGGEPSDIAWVEVLINNSNPHPLSEPGKKSMDMGMDITPSNESVIHGVVNITLIRVPAGTGLVAFLIEGLGIADINTTGPNLEIDTNREDGWGMEFDAGAYPDGEYNLSAIASDATSLFSAETENATVLGAVSTPIRIQNSPEELFILSPQIQFYKAVSIWPVSTTKEEMALAGDTGANVVQLFVRTEEKDGKLVLPENWGIPLKSRIRAAYRNGLAVSLQVFLPSGDELDKRFPYAEGSTYDLPPGYDMGPFTRELKQIYREVAIFAEENKVHSILIPIEIEAWIPRVFGDSKEYWETSSAMNVELTREIRNYYSGEIIGLPLGGMWGYDAPCCYTNVQVEKINFGDIDAIGMNTGSDYRTTGSPLGFVEEGLKRIAFTRGIAHKKGVQKLYIQVGGYPVISPWQGDRVAMYSEFFEKSQGKGEGYSVMLIPGAGDVYDNQAAEAAKIWYPKMGG